MPKQPDPSWSNHDRSGLDLAREIARDYRSGARDTGYDPPNRSTSDRAPSFQPNAPASGHWSTGQRGTGQRQNPEYGDDPVSVGQHVRNLIAERGWEDELKAQRVFAEWADIVGAEVAAHCQIIGQEGRRVHVQADSTAWATQFRLLTAQVVAKLNDRLGDGTIEWIEVRGPQAPSWKAGGRSVKGGRGPRDTYG